MDQTLLDTAGRAYGKPAPHPDDALARVGPGTPGGELLRRYWQPIALSSECTDLPKLVVRLGEELILFRNKKGEPGLLYPRCAHRGTSLLYGRVEEDGIRCCYHGWKFGAQGQCLEQPAEPEGGRNRGRIRQPWYPVVEQFGAIWTYMGPPDKQPLFPIFSCLENLGPTEVIEAIWTEQGPFPQEFNWFQRYDNTADHYHVPILHSQISGDQFPDPRLDSKIPEIKWKYSPDGQSILTYSKRILDNGDVWLRIEQGLIPNMLALPPFSEAALPYVDGECPAVSFFVPWDDTSFAVIQVFRREKDIVPYYLRDRYRSRKTKSWGELTPEERQRSPGDYEAQGGQGPITLHSEEHLAYSDTGVGMQRRNFRKQCETVANGGDPIGVAFKEEDRRVNIHARSWTISAKDYHGQEIAW